MERAWDTGQLDRARGLGHHASALRLGGLYLSAVIDAHSRHLDGQGDGCDQIWGLLWAWLTLGLFTPCGVYRKMRNRAEEVQ